MNFKSGIVKNSCDPCAYLVVRIAYFRQWEKVIIPSYRVQSLNPEANM